MLCLPMGVLYRPLPLPRWPEKRTIQDPCSHKLHDVCRLQTFIGLSTSKVQRNCFRNVFCLCLLGKHVLRVCVCVCVSVCLSVCLSLCVHACACVCGCLVASARRKVSDEQWIERHSICEGCPHVALHSNCFLCATQQLRLRLFITWEQSVFGCLGVHEKVQTFCLSLFNDLQNQTLET